MKPNYLQKLAILLVLIFMVGCVPTQRLVSPENPRLPQETPDTDISDKDSSDSLYIPLIALEDNGKTGEQIGCGDSLILVEVPIKNSEKNLENTIQLLLDTGEFYGQSGLYNALSKSKLKIENVDISENTATVNLSGSLMLGGTCDLPRVENQLEKAVLQFTYIKEAKININGIPLAEILSQK